MSSNNNNYSRNNNNNNNDNNNNYNQNRQNQNRSGRYDQRGNNQYQNQNASYSQTTQNSGYQTNYASANRNTYSNNFRSDSANSNQSGYNNQQRGNHYRNNNSGYQTNNRQDSASSRQGDRPYSNRGNHHQYRNQNSYANNQIVQSSRVNSKVKEMCKNEVIKQFKDFAYVDLRSVRSYNPHSFVFKKRNGKITIGQNGINFLVNHFDLNFNDLEFNIYRVDVKQVVENDKFEVNKKIKRIILKNFTMNCLKSVSEKQPIIVYDGDTLLFVESFYLLKDQNDEEIIDKKIYKYFVSSTNRVIKLDDLKRFLNGEENFNIGLVHPCIQVLNLLSKERLAIHFQCFGKFYHDGLNSFDLKDGHVIWKGFTLNARPSGNRMAFIMNSSGCVMPIKQPLLDYILERFRRLRDVNDISNNIADINEDIEGLKVNLTHLSYNKAIKIYSLSDQSANKYKFAVDGTNTEKTVAEYFKAKYKALKYPNLPLVVELKKNRKTGTEKISYYPIEICEVMSIKANVRESAKQKSDIIKETKEGPAMKFNRIMELRARIQDEDFKDVNSNMSNNMKNVAGNCLPYPSLIYGKNAQIRCNDTGSWNVNNVEFFKPTSFENTIAINFSSLNLDQVKSFFSDLENMAIQRGMGWINKTSVIAGIQNEIFDVLNKITENNKKWDIVFYVLDKKCEFHELFKTLSEVLFGLRSICILSENMTRGANTGRGADILRNICLKINERLDGINQTLIKDQYIKDVLTEPVMFISADVSHPGAGNSGFPSLAAVLGSVDEHAKKYACRMRAQWHQRSNKKKENEANEENESKEESAEKESGSAQEVIVDLKSIVEDLLQVHVNSRDGKIPTRLIYYRDGVSEGQFGIVADKELSMIKDAIRNLYPKNNIKVTFITVQKRHSTRIFMPDKNDVLNQNPKPGTVISEGVCNSNESESYLLSHKLSEHGTAKPSHYKCISDENNFTENQLNSLHFYLCHLYARCNRSVKIPTPVYYADLASTRGMLYLKIGTDKKWREEALKMLDNHRGQLQYFDIPIHTSIKNELFFI